MGGDEHSIAPDEAAFVLASHFHEGLVVEDRLGAINQARLAISYLRRRYDGPIGVWLNAIKKPSKEVAAANRAGLAESWIPLLGESGKGEKSARFHFLPR